MEFQRLGVVELKCYCPRCGVSMARGNSAPVETQPAVDCPAQDPLARDKGSGVLRLPPHGLSRCYRGIAGPGVSYGVADRRAYDERGAPNGHCRGVEVTGISPEIPRIVQLSVDVQQFVLMQHHVPRAVCPRVSGTRHESKQRCSTSPSFGEHSLRLGAPFF